MDFDGDGFDDVISGGWPGELYLFRGTAHGFEKSSTIRNVKKQDINVGSASAVYAVDWDSDDDLDLLVGNINGAVWLVTNQGTRTEPAYMEPVQLKAGGNPLQVRGGDAGPVAADWDGDGRLDLLVGTGQGGVEWYRNLGTVEQPRLAPATTLLGASPTFTRAEQGGQNIPWGMRAKICVTDYNADGRTDLLLGDFSMQTIANGGLTEDQLQKKREVEEKHKALMTRWQERFAEWRGMPEEGTPEHEEYTEMAAELTALTQQLAQYQPQRYEFGGFVWFFERLPSQEPAQPAR